jgi:hypothetical protein
VVLVLSLLGPRALSLGGAQTPEFGNVFPLFVAFVLVGVMPNVPLLQEIERQLRRYWHERAFIPGAARATAEKMAAAEFDFEPYCVPDTLAAIRGVEAADFERPRACLEYTWARLSCLSYELKSRLDANSTACLDGDLLDKYGSDLDRILDKCGSLEPDVAQYRADRLKVPHYSNDQLQRAIRLALHQLYILLGCAVRLKLRPSADINAALRPFGFLLDPAPPQQQNRNVIVVGLAVMASSLFVLVFTAVQTNWLLGHAGLWHASDNFPRLAYEPFLYAGSALFAHGVAIWVADHIRTRRLRSGTWYACGASACLPNRASQILVALVCSLSGYVTLLLWGLIFQGITMALLAGAAFYALLPAATGGFYVYHLDNVELNRRPGRTREIGAQAAVTGFCGFTAASAWHTYVGTTPDAAYDAILLITLMGAAVGASLAWYIPAASASNRQDPLDETRAERVAALRASALGSFKDAAAAERWMQKPNPILGNQTPQAAAAEIAGYEKALSLLRRPELVVVG